MIAPSFVTEQSNSDSSLSFFRSLASESMPSSSSSHSLTSCLTVLVSSMSLADFYSRNDTKPLSFLAALMIRPANPIEMLCSAAIVSWLRRSTLSLSTMALTSAALSSPRRFYSIMPASSPSLDMMSAIV